MEESQCSDRLNFNYRVTEWVPKANQIAFASIQQEKNNRLSIIKTNEDGMYALFVRESDCKFIAQSDLVKTD